MKVFSYITFMLIMAGLGASDALRGVFAPIFCNHFALGSLGFSLIVTVGYAGNLIFLLAGSSFADRFGKKRVSAIILLLWIFSLLLYILTDNYVLLLVGMFVSMGTSTLLNTMVNIMTPLIFVSAPALMVNTLFFMQGIGTSGSQALAGRFASSFASWKVVNVILLTLGIIGFILFIFVKIQEPKNLNQPSEKGNSHAGNGGYLEVVKNKAFVFLFLMFGFYFIAEHGVLNWLVLYGRNQFSLSQGTASLYLSLFFGGITVGRLLFAPIVQKLGIRRSLNFFGATGSILYVASLVLTAVFKIPSFLIVLAFSGLILSILYPTMVLFIRNFYDESIISTAAGTIISVATIFDISFNLLFGKAVDLYGFSKSIFILPVCMVLFYVTIFFCNKKAQN